MPRINPNKIFGGKGKEEEPRGGSSNPGRGRGIFSRGVDLNRLGIVAPGAETQPNNFETQNIFQRIRASRQAKQAAEAQRLEQQRQRAEQERQAAITAARNQIREEVQKGPTGQTGDPGVDYGLPERIKDVAKDNPLKAYRMAQAYIRNIKHYNAQELQRIEEDDQRRVTAEATRQELKITPIRAWGKVRHINTDIPVTFQVAQKTGHIIGGSLSLLGKIAISALTTKPSRDAKKIGETFSKRVLNQIIVDEKGITTIAPFTANISQTRSPEKSDDFVRGVNAPWWYDPIHGLLTLTKGKDWAEKWLPLGTIKVTDKTGQLVYTEAPALFPGRKLQQINEKLVASIIPELEPPHLAPVPKMASLLGPAAEELGLLEPPIEGEIVE